MNTMVKFSVCTLSDEELVKKVDKLTDEMFQKQEVPTRNIPAEPNNDYDLLVGELLIRFSNQVQAVVMPNEVLAGGRNKIILTTYQIFEIANYAGLKVEMPDDNDKEIEYLLDDDMEIFIEDDNENYKGLGIFTVEYPDEGALPLAIKPA